LLSSAGMISIVIFKLLVALVECFSLAILSSRMCGLAAAGVPVPAAVR
jgi:hypothetical protein